MMNILWITNIIMPEAESLLSSATSLKSSGGWMVGLANQLVKNEDVRLTIVTVSKRVDNIKKLKGDNITYYILPERNYAEYWSRVKDEVRPKIVHLHGTESPWGMSYVEECGSDYVLVSIQGLLSAYYDYYYYGLTKWDIILSSTIGSLLFGGILKGYRSFKKDSIREVFLLKKINHIIGRTSWDRARTWAINPQAQYHFCNEILRDEFYFGPIWDYSKCIKHTIFLSQASYPIKGLHQIMKAMPLILRHYPDAQIRIAGSNITKRKGLKGYLAYSDYSYLINNMIHKLHLEEHVTFTGSLDAEGMKREYLSANVFVCPSTIENSPNSLGEAQILGVPCISSYIGGVADMIPNSDCGYMYRFEETEMLAKIVCDIFAKSKFTGQAHMINVAQRRHSPNSNVETLIKIYKEVINSND